ncbi:unnamed protein product [Amoebophrya sp. A120]|nr:unnamed protein product [Amoebophrya sp. A120]|eukprot:GSA120T00011890001.1
MHEKNTNPLSDFVSWVGGVFSSSSSKHQLQYDEDGNPVVFGQNGALQAGETQVQQNPVTGSWSFKKHAEELFGKKKKKKKRRRAKLLMPRLNAIAGSNKQKQMMRKTLSDTDIYSNLNNHKENDNWSESSEDEEDSDNSSAQSVKLKKKMIKVLVKQQDNAKTHPHYKVYKCTCYSCTVWAAFASFFLIFGGILYFTSILPSLRFIYNEYGTAERIEAQFVHFLEQSSFDVVEVLNQAVQQGLYKEPLHFQHLDWLLTPLLQQRRAGVNRLELGFLGTRKPVTEHGIIFRKTGPLGHFILQSDMYPSCVSIGAFGCVPDMKIPQRSWYQRLTKISFENLYLIYPLDLLTMKVSPENFEMSKQSIVKMNEWDWFRYVLAKQDINETSMVSNNEIRIDEWKLAYEECHAAAASGDFCDAGGNPLVAVFNNPLNAIIGARASASGQSGSGGSTSATGVSSATVSASASSNSTAIMISSASTSSTSTLTTTAPAPLQVLNTTPTSTTTITLTIPSFPNVVDGCFTAYQITDNYLYFHFKHDRSEHLYVIDPPESCYRSDSGQSRGINWEEQTIARQRAYLQGRKWQRRIYFEWNQDGPDFVSTSGTQIDLSGDAFKFSPAMGLTFKLEFPDAPLDPNLQNLNLAEMQVTHIIGRISVDLTGCSSFMRDPFVDEYLGAESSAAQVREDFEAFIVDKGGRIVCARSLDDQVRKVDNSGKNTQLQFKKIWELAHFKDDLGLSPTSWALTVAKLDTIPTLPPLSGGMVGVRSKVDQFELPNYANEYETTTSASSSAELDHEDANLGPLGWGSPFVIRRIRHSRMAGFYVVTRMTTAPFSSTASGIAAVFMTLVILGGSPFVLCCSIVGLFAIRDVAIYKKETQRQRALLEAKATLEAVAAATGGGGTAGRNLNQTEVDDAKMIEAAA